MAIDRIKEIVEEYKIETVILGSSDFYGHLRGKRLPIDEFYRVAEKGIAFSSWYIVTNLADEIIPDTSLASLEAGLPDIHIRPDLESFRVVPWFEKTAMVMCDFYRPDGTPLEASPRWVLKKLVDKAEAMNFRTKFATELEFYIFREDVKTLRDNRHRKLTPITPDIHCYSIYEGGLHEYLIGRIRETLKEYIEACNPEWGPGQFEINLKHNNALAMADITLMFKTCVKDLMAREGYSVTFMPKWHQDHSGSSGHIHQCLVDKNGDPTFYDASKPYNMSDTMMYYLGGNLELVQDIMLFYALNINSYKRMVDLSLGGINLSWGIDNRTVSFRVINHTPKACRLENRVPGADMNPYLAIAGCLGSGLYGIENKIEPPKPVEGNAYALSQEDFPMLPNTLGASIDKIQGSPKAGQIFGDELITALLELSRWEQEQFRVAVTDWERHRYLEMV